MPYVPSTSVERVDHRVLEVAVERRLDQVREHLGVGLRHERVPGLLEHRAQRAVVLDDAVVHDGDRARAVVCGCALHSFGGPCVAQRVCAMPTLPWTGFALDRLLELRDLALRLPRLDARCRSSSRCRPSRSRGTRGASGPRSAAASRFFGPDVSDDSAHGRRSSARVIQPTRCSAPNASSGSRDRRTSSPRLRLVRRLGDHAHDRLRSRRSHVHPPIRPRQPQPVLRVRRRVAETPRAARRTPCPGSRSAGRACPSRSRTAAASATICDSGRPSSTQQLQKQGRADRRVAPQMHLGQDHPAVPLAADRRAFVAHPHGDVHLADRRPDRRARPPRAPRPPPAGSWRDSSRPGRVRCRSTSRAASASV